jgi:hypothetical protein
MYVIKFNKNLRVLSVIKRDIGIKCLKQKLIRICDCLFGFKLGFMFLSIVFLSNII